MSKRGLVDEIISRLTSDLEASARSARAAHAEATDEQCKAENKYDTRGLEASYLARGQSRQAAETEQARRQFEGMVVREFGADEAIDIGALVEVEAGTERSWYFIGPSAGGIEVVHEGREIFVITPHSPLGQQLLGRRRKDRLENGYLIASVC